MVIGKGGRHIPKERALEHVAGYTCFVDGSVRDFQKFSVTSGKNFPGTGPLGRWMVTTDEIPDPTKMTLITRLNGQEMQRSGTDLLIYSIRTSWRSARPSPRSRPATSSRPARPKALRHRRNRRSG